MTPPDSRRGAGQVVGLFPELLGLGGIQEASRQTVCALQDILARRGILGTYQGLNDPLGLHSLQIQGRSISFRGFKRSKVRFVLRALLLARKKPRIVLAAHPNLALPAQWMKSVSPSTKVIVLCHGVEVWEPLPTRRRDALLAADLVLAPSSFTAEKLQSVQGVSAKKIRVLPWPLNAEMLGMSETRANLTLPAGFPEGRVILTVGRWAAAERYKGADDLVRAIPELVASFPGLHLVAVGGGDDLPRLKGIVDELGVAASVHFLTGIRPEQLAACYAHAEIFALPSIGEGFGIVFLEAMAFGIPVVGAAAGGITDIVNDGIDGLLIPGKNPAALVQALDRLLRDREFGAAMGKRGAEIIREKYGFQAFENALERILVDCGIDSPAAA
jgi:phosphatidylinositol alpha-1,6-mannosyltransferase